MNEDINIDDYDGNRDQVKCDGKRRDGNGDHDVQTWAAGNFSHFPYAHSPTVPTGEQFYTRTYCTCTKCGCERKRTWDVLDLRGWNCRQNLSTCEYISLSKSDRGNTRIHQRSEKPRNERTKRTRSESKVIFFCLSLRVKVPLTLAHSRKKGIACLLCLRAE